MKKTLTVFLAVLLLFVLTAATASAASPKDGTYKVPLSFVKADEEKESLAAKFFESYGYMEVSGGQKALYIPMRESIQNMGQTMSESDKAQVEVFYYKGGKVDKQNGQVVTAEKQSKISVGGTTHTYLFKIPMEAENDIGLKFKAPGMPSFVNPSARVRLDLAKTQPIQGVGAAAEGHGDAEPAKAPEPTTAPQAVQTPAQPVAPTTAAAVQASVSVEAEEDTPLSTASMVLIGVGVAAVLAGIIIAVTVSRKNDRELAVLQAAQKKNSEAGKDHSND